MIRDLLTAEAQRDPYVWAAVLVAHAGIGVALWAISGSALFISLAYLAFEVVQAATSKPLFWDSALDWAAVSLGVVLGRALDLHQEVLQIAAVGAVAIIAAIGAAVRARHSEKIISKGTSDD